MFVLFERAMFRAWERVSWAGKSGPPCAPTSAAAGRRKRRKRILKINDALKQYFGLIYWIFDLYQERA
jgi:hypothetical protein